MLDNHDSTVGVNWEQIGYWADNLYPENKLSRQQKSFRDILKIAPEIRHWDSAESICEPKQLRFSANGVMPLNIEFEKSGDNHVIATLSHYYRHSTGEMVPDPEMRLLIDIEGQRVKALDYRDNVSHQKVERENGSENIKLRIELDSFLSKWLTNIRDQEYQPVQSQELSHSY